MAGSDPPSRNGVTYLVAITVLKLIVCQVLYGDFSPNDSGISRARPLVGRLQHSMTAELLVMVDTNIQPKGRAHPRS